jgi:hypothetical protein
VQAIIPGGNTTRDKRFSLGSTYHPRLKLLPTNDTPLSPPPYFLSSLPDFFQGHSFSSYSSLLIFLISSMSPLHLFAGCWMDPFRSSRWRGRDPPTERPQRRGHGPRWRVSVSAGAARPWRPRRTPDEASQARPKQSGLRGPSASPAERSHPRQRSSCGPAAQGAPLFFLVFLFLFLVCV